MLDSVLTSMVKANVAWVPTLDIYEASRDLQRAQNQPWFTDYLHPSLANYFKPDPANHGSYFIGWSSTDEVYWKENYRIWMAALRDFERKGGTHRLRRRRGVHLPDVRLRPDPRDGAARGGRLPAAQDHPALHGQQREDPRPGKTRSGACASAGSPT